MDTGHYSQHVYCLVATHAPVHKHVGNDTKYGGMMHKQYVNAQISFKKISDISANGSQQMIK